VSDIVIRVEHLSKYYRLGQIGGDTLRADVNRWWAAARGKPDPLARIGEQGAGSPRNGELWALRDVSFDVRQGEVLGIIGRNGAGKSTLLKILSRITAPTTGTVKIRGRVGSLLEVGTGFHPELSGRENIYLNGAILGMKRVDITRRLDDIVDFAEIEAFLDTPVKRYSSGMYVRLAFAVAAHLEPEILIVDEVLAVGDAAFQKKCLGKMEDVSKRQGRTVLFVSHNMAMISSLCGHGLLLDHGEVRNQGPAGAVILGYATGGESSPAAVDYRKANRSVGDGMAQLLAGAICDLTRTPVTEVAIGEGFVVRMDYRIAADIDRRFVPNFHFYRADGSCAFVVAATDVTPMRAGVYRAECRVPANFLNDGLYSVSLALSSFESGVDVHFHEQGALMFNVRDPMDDVATRVGYNGPIPGAVRPVLQWTISAVH